VSDEASPAGPKTESGPPAPAVDAPLPIPSASGRMAMDDTGAASLDGESSVANDGRDGPPLVVMATRWFLAAAIMLLLPRQWFSAAMAFAAGVGLFAYHRFGSARPRRPHS
jgi:hypothetical protein